MFALALAACGAGGDDDVDAANSDEDASAAEGSTAADAPTDASSTTTDTDQPSEPTTSTAPPSSTTTIDPPATDSATTAPPDPSCRSVADFEDEEELRRWRIVNDGVMGGRSSAEADVVDGVLILDGEIVTDGGGFSSVRLALDRPLTDATGLLLRLRTDGRPYEVTLADTAPGRDRRTSHQGAIAAVGADEWEEVLVDFDDLDASIFGRPVEVDPFEPGSAVEVGIILADGTDGPFNLEVDWILACP